MVITLRPTFLKPSNALDEIVAVKTVDASRFRSISEIELVEDEIRALSSVKHDNIINLHEVIFKNHIFHFIMDFAAGGSLVRHPPFNHKTQPSNLGAIPTIQGRPLS